ncbi:MAG: chemotaxis protein CheW [Pseudanabaena sp. ELA607]
MVNDCWNHIGVTGDRSCGELKNVIHCRNCPIYAAAGRGLLEQEAPPEYLKEWTEVLAKQPSTTVAHPHNLLATHGAESLSVMIVRLSGEWFALPVRLLQEVTHPCIIHTLPHRSDDLFLGLVNIRGEILLCVSLRHLLDLPPQSASAVTNTVNTKRMLVLANGEHRWVFTVDEVCGVYRFTQDLIQSPPVVVAKAMESYTKGVVYWQNHQVNYLDTDLLCYTLNQRIL